MRAHVAHDLQDLLVSLTKTQHQAGLGRNAWLALFELLQQLEGVSVIRSWSRLLVEPGHRLEVVVHDIWWAGVEDFQCPIKPATEIRHQHLDLGLRRKLAHLADALDKMRRATITQVITIH